ncbi:MAG: C39 family peptidase [Candidatus Magasanikbacteria bacterium]
MEGKKKSLFFLSIIIFSFLFFNLVSAENILNVPFISQYPPGTSWNFTLNCGPTSYLMLESYYTNKKLEIQSIKDIDDWLYTNYNRPINNYNGYYTDTADLKILATEYGDFTDEDVIKTRSLDDIKEAVNNNFPVIVAVYTNMMAYKNRSNGHFMVLTGITDDTVYVNDPGKTYGKNMSYSLEQFLYAWSLQNNAALIFYPPNSANTKKLDQLAPYLLLNNNYSYNSVFSEIFSNYTNIFDLNNLKDLEVKDKKLEEKPLEEDVKVFYNSVIEDKNLNLQANANEELNIKLKVKNTSNVSWERKNFSVNVVGGEVQNKIFYHNSWITKLRPALQKENIVESNNLATFDFVIQAPDKPGDYVFKLTVVRQSGNSFSNVGTDVFVLNLEVLEEKKVDEKIEAEPEKIVIEEKKEEIVTKEEVIKKEEIIQNNFISSPSYSSGSSSGSSSNGSNQNNDDVVKSFFFNFASSTPVITNQSKVVFNGEKTKELTRLKINNLDSLFFDQGNIWSVDFSLQEGDNNILMSFFDDTYENSVSGTTYIALDSTAPDKPILQAVVVGDNQKQINLTWQSNDVGSGIDYYVLEFKQNSVDDWQSLVSSTFENSFVFPAEIAKEYSFRVKAYDKLGNESLWSNDGQEEIISVDWSKEVVINEIAYAPTYSNNCGGEWIELYNPGSTDIDLSGWKLEILDSSSSSTVDLTGFVSSTSYKVIPISNMSDIGAKITLKNSLGNIVDETDQSLGWFPTLNTNHSRSLERINFERSGNFHSNWRENNSLKFSFSNSSCGENYSSQGFDNNSFYFLSKNLDRDYVFSNSSTDNFVLTLTKDHNPYILSQEVVLPSNYTLILEPGVVVVGIDKDSVLKVSGKLQINGTEDDPVYFTSARDKTVADWYALGNPSNKLAAGDPAPGDWSAIVVKGGVVEANYANFWYGGSTYRDGSCYVCYSQVVIRNESGTVKVTNSNFDNIFLKDDYSDHQDAYIWDGGGNIEVDNTIFNNGYYSLVSSYGSNINFTNNVISNFTFQPVSPVVLTSNGTNIVKWSNNSLIDNNNNFVTLPALEVNEDYTLTTDVNNVYFMGINVTSTATLNVLPGVHINLFDKRFLKVEGNLQALGTSENPIEVCPYAVCGGIWLQDSQGSKLSFVNLKNGGYHDNREYPYDYLSKYYSPFWLVNSKVEMDNVNIFDSRFPNAYSICSLNSDLQIKDSNLGWTVKRDYTIIGGIYFYGGNLFLDNTNFHFNKYAIDASKGDGVVTYENMSPANFINSLPANGFKNWLPASLFPFVIEYW